MPDIWYRIGFETSPEDVYNSLATVDGIASWWTPYVEGEYAVGRTLGFCFGNPEPSAIMEVVELAPPSRISWRCVRGPDEWLATTVTFDLSHNEGETVLQFKHAGWQKQNEFMAHCSTAWASYLLGLKRGLQGGKPNAWPDGTVSRWG